MDIVYLHQYFKFPNEAGGTRSYDLATEFTKKSYKVQIITSTSDPKYKSRQTWVTVERDQLIIHYVYLPYGNHLTYLKRTLVFFKFLWFATLKLLALNGDVVLATSTPLTIGIPAVIKKLIHKTPFIFEVRDVWPETVIAVGAVKKKFLQNILYRLEKLIYNYADAIVPLSVDMNHSIVSRYPELACKPIEVIENISEIERFQKVDQTTSIIADKIGFKPRFTVLYAGTFGRVNGLGYTLDLAKALVDIDPSIVFVLIGSGAELELLIEKSVEFGVLNKNVFFLDQITKDQLSQFYYEADMGSSFVIGVKELWANSANKFFDTLAAGRPILINHGGWQADLISTHNLGFVLPTRLDADEITSFVSYTRNCQLLIEQRQNAFLVAKQKYSLAIASKKYESILKQVKRNSDV